MEYIINVVGMGYIGLPTALMLAAKNVQVLGTDNDIEKINILNDGKVTFEEEGLLELYQTSVANGIIFQNNYAQADIYIVAVPTPFDKNSKKVVADYLVEAVKGIISVCRQDAIIVIESTVSPGTIDIYIRPIIEKNNKERGFLVKLAHAPERIIPGKMIEELKHNNRTIGADQFDTAEKVREVYAMFCQGEITLTSIKTAEMTKVVENAFRDVNIAFANELVKICREAGADVHEIISIANKHPRVNILSPGPGVGGHCISVDPWFLVGDYPGLANIILAARNINDSMPEYVLKRIYEIMIENGISEIGRVGLYGLTYKENVDDIRESPTLQMIQCMKEHLASGIKIYDPYVKNMIVKNQYFEFDKFINDIDLLVIMVGHDEIKNCINNINQKKIIFDTRNFVKNRMIYKL